MASRKGMAAAYLLFDVETSGRGAAGGERPIQLAYLALDTELQWMGGGSHVLKGAHALTPWVLRNVPITLEQIKHGEEPSAAFAEMLTLCGPETVFVAHNFDFDSKFLRPYAVPKNSICTMKTTTSFCALPPRRRGSWKWPTLGELAAKLMINIKPSEMHNAETDVAVLWACIRKLKELGRFN